MSYLVVGFLIIAYVLIAYGLPAVLILAPVVLLDYLQAHRSALSMAIIMTIAIVADQRINLDSVSWPPLIASMFNDAYPVSIMIGLVGIAIGLRSVGKTL